MFRSLFLRKRRSRLGALCLVVGTVTPGIAAAADLTIEPLPQEQKPRVALVCGAPPEIVILFDEEGVPTVPARTPYFYCVTNTTLLPGDIPPPPEYCCG